MNTPLCKIHCFLHCAVHMWSSASCNILWRSVSTAPTHVPNHCSSHGCCLIFYYVATSVITPFCSGDVDRTSATAAGDLFLPVTSAFTPPAHVLYCRNVTCTVCGGDGGGGGGGGGTV